MATQKTRRGRKPDSSSKSGKIREMLKAGAKPMDIAKQLKCTPGLVYNVRTKMEGGANSPARAARTGKAKGGASMDGLEAIVSAVKNAEQEREKLRKALVQIQTVIEKALA